MKKFKKLDEKTLIVTTGGDKKSDFEAGRTLGRIVRYIFGGGY